MSSMLGSMLAELLRATVMPCGSDIDVPESNEHGRPAGPAASQTAKAVSAGAWPIRPPLSLGRHTFDDR